MKPMLKRLAAALLCALLCLFAATAMGATENGFEYTAFEGEAYVDNYIGTDEEVVVPATLGGCPVVSISSSVFSQSSTLRKVTLPDTLTELDPGMFYGCTAISEVLLSPAPILLDI